MSDSSQDANVPMLAIAYITNSSRQFIASIKSLPNNASDMTDGWEDRSSSFSEALVKRINNPKFCPFNVTDPLKHTVWDVAGRIRFPFRMTLLYVESLDSEQELQEVYTQEVSKREAENSDDGEFLPIQGAEDFPIQGTE